MKLVASTAVVALTVVACAAGGANTEAQAPSPSNPTAGRQIDVSRTIVTPSEAVGIDEMYERARHHFEAAQYRDAADGFRRVVDLDPNGPLAKDALFYGASAHDLLGENVEALARYEQVATRFPDDPLARDALLRCIRLSAFLEQWSRIGTFSDRLLARYSSLSPIEQVVAYSGKALTIVFGSDPEAASPFIETARGVVERYHLDEAGTIPRDLAQLYFALGELRRFRAEQIQFDPVPPDFVETLERRCRLLLDAQSAYSDAMRAYDAHWSAMAGYRVGELYQSLHGDLMKMPAPSSADTSERRALFEGAMRLRYEVLLQKGKAMMEHTIEMAERTQEKSEWVARAREALRAIDHAISDENAALNRLPYSREQLQRALEDLAKKGARSAPGRSAAGK